MRGLAESKAIGERDLDDFEVGQDELDYHGGPLTMRMVLLLTM